MNNVSPIFTMEEILKATGGALISGASENLFYGISTDSRLVSKGNIFVALQGEKFDGHNFLQAALDKGAAGVLVHDEQKIKQTGVNTAPAVIKVADTLAALGDLAHEWRRKFSIQVIGLTGSSGKTTTKEMMAAIIGQKKNVMKTEGNLNNLIGLPQTIFRINDEYELVILEMGTNTHGEIKRLTQIAEPDIGLITNIGPAHLEGFGSIDGVREEKGDLFYNMDKNGIAIINLDDEHVRIIAEKWKGRRITFGMSSNADVSAKDIGKNSAKGMHFNLVIGAKMQKVEMKIIGSHHVYNALAAAAGAKAVGINDEMIVDGLKAFHPFSGRMEIIKLRNGAYLLDDSYNANPSSVREALMTLKDLKNHHNCYVFLGDMLELGAAADEMHRRIGMLIATIGVNALFLQGDFSAVTAAGAMEGGLLSQNIYFSSASEENMNYLKKNLKKGDWILVKGSRRMQMEKIAAKIYEDFGGEKTRGNNNGKIH
jgi:UDP-N-acetylmuramoyl-tripeptide--D-alanyl-D-alanine ligase